MNNKNRQFKILLFSKLQMFVSDVRFVNSSANQSCLLRSLNIRLIVNTIQKVMKKKQKHTNTALSRSVVKKVYMKNVFCNKRMTSRKTSRNTCRFSGKEISTIY